MEKIKKYKTEILTTLVCILPIIYGVIVWDKLPEMIPTHWDMEGKVNGYSSKTFAVFGMPLFLAACNLICQIAMNADPKKQNYADKLKILVVWIVPVVSLLVVPSSLLVAQGVKIDIALIVPLFCGVLFLIIGNYLPKCKQNYTLGIKIPWTLNSEENWNKTHRMAGILWSVGSIIIIIGVLLGYQIVLFPIVILMVIVPTIYSYTLYKKGI